MADEIDAGRSVGKVTAHSGDRSNVRDSAVATLFRI
jgi:hypothetical protein